jgi:16S rRNA (cytosine967-C5)-methyltransferase
MNSPTLAVLLGHTADAVAAVRAGRSLTEVLAALPADVRAGTQALSFDVLRRLGSAQALRRLLAPKAPPAPLDALVTSALALLWPSDAPRYPAHTLVNQAVAAAQARAPEQGGFVNAVLRRYLREHDALTAAAQAAPEGAWNHPAWWIERVRRDWPDDWQRLLHAANAHPPMTLRVNARRGDAAAYVERLAAAGRPARSVGSHAVVLERPVPVNQLPGFGDGDVSVQDAAAQRAAPLLLGGAALPACARVLDACAAPGGKTAHLLELADLDLTAVDVDARRLALVGATLERLRLPAARLQAADARDTAAWWDGQPFDAVLLDAPCTASGIVRRHPDVRWLRRAADIGALGRVQAALLDALWPLVKPGGRLLYATCSIFRAEGGRQIDAFLQRLPAGAARLDPASPGHLHPLADNASEASGEDGFFYALLHKTA